MHPELVSYTSETEYLEHYKRVYCRNKILAFDGIRVFFKPDKFWHAFYESNPSTGRKAAFSSDRASRIDWIKATLENPEADCYKGWHKNEGILNHRRASIAFDDFVVIIEFSLWNDEQLKGNFVTAYLANRSIDKIRNAPTWDQGDCINYLKSKKKSDR